MIPYDDLVAALSAWRARQGLPVSTMGGGAAPSPGSGPHAQPGSGPGSGPNRGAPPAPPRGNKPSVPPPLAMDDMQEVDDAEMLDEQYENEGQDFAMQFGANGGGEAESTAIGNAPERPTDPSDFNRGRGGGRGGEDW